MIFYPSRWEYKHDGSNTVTEFNFDEQHEFLFRPAALLLLY
jgi:hypothetical protein